MLVIYFISAIPALHKPLQFDEAEYAAFSRQINKTGLTVIDYYGENMQEGFTVNGKFFPLKYGFYSHPPMYPYFLAIITKFFGDFDYIYRLVSMLFVLFTLFLLNIFIKWYYGKTGRYKSQVISLIASSVFLFSPLTFLGSQLVDIDNSMMLLGLTFFIFLFSYWHVKQRLRFGNLLLLGVIFCINLLIKDTTAPIVILCIFIFYLLNNRANDGLKICLAIVFWGITFFIFIWYTYCKKTGADPFLFLLISFDMFKNRSGNSTIIEHLRLVKWNIFWFTVPLGLLVAISFYAKVKLWIRFLKQDIFLLFIIICVAIFTVYSLVLTGMYNIKYIVPVMPFIAIIVADYVCEHLRFTKRLAMAGLSLFLVLFLYYFIFIKDILLTLWLPNTVQAGSFLKQPKLIAVGAYFIPLIAGISGILLFARKNFLNKIIFFCLIGYFSIGISQCLRQGLSNYSLTYNYGERGTRETIEFLQKNTSKNEILICRMDIGLFYLQCRYYWDYILAKPEELSDLLKKQKIKYIVFSDKSRFLPNKELEGILERYCKLEKSIGDFSIYCLKDKS